MLTSGAPGPELDSVRRKLTLLGVSIVLIVFLMPIPFSTIAPAVIWLPEQAQVRPLGNGFIKTLPTQDGKQVKVGDLLAVMENPNLTKLRAKLTSKLDGLQADQFQLMLTNPAKGKNISEEIINVQKELAHIKEKISELNVVAQVNGQLVMPHQADKLGTYVRRGDNMGYVFENAAIRLRAAVAEKNAYLVRNNTRKVSAWLVESPHMKLLARMTTDTPAATRILPSPALGDHAGGRYVIDPADKEGTLAIEPVFLFDLKLADSKMIRVGGRALVRFEHEATPLATQLYRRARQLFLHNFEPST
jgi:putative peptide zinc metalloprotease protein